MKLIGLTGSIGSGKSTVAKMLAEKGAAILDADRAARDVVEPDEPAFDEIIGLFGPEVVADDGALDRAAIAAKVFADADLKKKLEAITHPRIGALIASRIAERVSAGAEVIVVEVPLLFETGQRAAYPFVLVVAADRESSLNRLINKGYSSVDARARLESQISIDRKKEDADYVIENNVPLDKLKEKVDAFWDFFTAEPNP